jgi:hypothetical protein
MEKGAAFRRMFYYSSIVSHGIKSKSKCAAIIAPRKFFRFMRIPRQNYTVDLTPPCTWWMRNDRQTASPFERVPFGVPHVATGYDFVNAVPAGEQHGHG